MIKISSTMKDFGMGFGALSSVNATRTAKEAKAMRWRGEKAHKIKQSLVWGKSV